MKGTVLVTGATGFLGAHMARTFLQNGWHVAVLVRPDSSNALLADVIDRVTPFTYDGTYATMRSALALTHPTVVLHMASCFRVSHQVDDLDALVDANIHLGLHLAEAMAETGCQRLVNTGSSWQHYMDAPYCPVNLYAATKQAFDDILRYYVEVKELRVVTLQLFDTYGPGDPRQKLLPTLKQIAANDKTLALSPGDQRLDLVHVCDVASAYRLAAERLLSAEPVEATETFAVTSGQTLSLRELVSLVPPASGQRNAGRWLAGKLSSGCVLRDSVAF